MLLGNVHVNEESVEPEMEHFLLQTGERGGEKDGEKEGRRERKKAGRNGQIEVTKKEL